ncbi:Serine--tRNA ligase [Labeo rohita]|uniref:Serine--tRNA ligase n=1 Tax=Labeo rohita TaxID=84645 RepID=A0ABQ8MGB7_LABRO|nr:Serine--tRNA ligase [Labeo rohita]
MAPSSLLFTLARQSTSSTGLPRPSGSALVSHQPSAASGLHASGSASSLQPSGSVRLPPSLQLHLGPLLLHLHCAFPDPHLRLGCLSNPLDFCPPDPLRHPGSSALRLCQPP